MNEISDRIPQSTIDALAAGELHGEPYRAALASLEAHPERWRDCALAFLYEQALARDLQMLADGSVDWNHDVPHSESERPSVASPQGASSAEGLDLPIDAETQSVSLPISSSQREAEKQHRRLQRLQRITSVAALLLISFTIGWFGAGLRHTASEMGSAETPLSNGRDTGLATNGSSIAPNPKLQQSPWLERNDLQFVGEPMLPVNGAPSPLLQRLEAERQIELETSGAYVPVFEGDNIILVPVHQYKVKPRLSF